MLGDSQESPSSSAGTLSPPARSSPPAIAGLKPPVKSSVGNCQAFVSIGGSPVKVPKRRGHASSKDAKTTQQKSIEDSFRLGTPSERPGGVEPRPGTPGGPSPAAVRGTQRNTSSHSSPTTKAAGSCSVPSSGAPCCPSPATPTLTCPVCHTKVQESEINQHLDACLS